MKKVTMTMLSLLLLVLTNVYSQSANPGDVIINEVAWMGTSSSSVDEWIELYNTTDTPIDISTWSIYGADTGVLLNFADADGSTNTVIPAKGFLIFANAQDNVNDPAGTSIVDIWDSTIGLNNTNPGQIILYDAPNGGGNEIDRVNQVAGDWFAGDNTNKNTMERVYASVSGTEASNWVTNNGIIQNGFDADNNAIHGTPKAQNSPLIVAFHTPDKNELDVAASSNVEVQFNQNIDITTINENTFNVDGSMSGEIQVTFSGGGTMTITLDPANNFKCGETVTVTLTTAIQSTSGVALAIPYTFWFTVEAPNGYGQFFDSGQTLGNYASTHVALGDLDGDGDLDAFEANWNQANRVWLNDGDGNFTDSSQELGNATSTVVKLGDLDGDGDLDAFVGNGGQSGVNGPNKVWLNDGNGNFTDSGQNIGNSGSEGVALADLDGDGDLDAFVANYNNQANKVWFNDGNGNFTDSGQSLGSEVSNLVALGDLDGDGDIDAYVGNIGAQDEVWLNDGNGNFTDSNQSLNSSIYGWELYNLGDIDNDGDLDVVLPKGGVWLNDGNGNLTDSVQSVGEGYGLALADVDADGDLDAFYSIPISDKTVWLNDGNGVFTFSGQTFSTGNSYIPALGDLDGDGDIDCFSGNQYSPNQVWLNSGFDLGDLPDDYGITAITDDGARHELVNTGGINLGISIDSEIDGQESADAGRAAVDGDDGNGVDDEDGVTVNGEWQDGTNGGAVEVTVTGGSGYLSAWIDWDDNNNFTDAGDQVLNMEPVVAGTQTIQFDIPVGTIPIKDTYNRFARFRLVPDNGTLLTLTGMFNNGEVEDYYLQFTGKPVDTDNDGIPDNVEGSGDRDGDGIPDNEDYDPSGWIYDEATGDIITGGSISVSPAAGVNIIQDGSNGYYQFTVSQAGDYTLSYTPPQGFSLSSTCPNQSATLDPDPVSDPNPLVVGLGSKDGANNTLTNWDCQDNPYYFDFHLELGDPIIINNNIPLASQPTNIVLSSFSASVDDDQVILTWITESEPNNAGFDVLRSRQGGGEYTKINAALIPAQGNAVSGATYTYMDQPEQGGTYYYKIRDINLQGDSSFHGPIIVSGVTAVEVEKVRIPNSYQLSQNYPNPFNPETTIGYGLPKAGRVTITIYDVNGKVVRHLISQQRTAGNHSVTWDGRDDNGVKVTSGVYFYELKVADSAGSGNGFHRTLKMILMK